MDRFSYRKDGYEKHPEVIANKFTLRCMTVAIAMLCFVWLLNILEIFSVHPGTIHTAVVLDLLVYVAGVVYFGWADLRKEWVKYLVILWAVAIVTIVTTFLTFHAYLVCVMPIIYCSMYKSKYIIWWGYFWTVVGIALTVFVGYEKGLCDLNVVLLSGDPLAVYLGPNGEFLLSEINREAWTLLLFFIMPRSLICLTIALSCDAVAAIVRRNIKYAQDLEAMAEVDEMTGVFNRNKYLNMLSEGYAKEDKISVIFWDINYLKKTNDTYGHECGDRLITTVAAMIKKISNQFDHVYRIGGDEFVMITRGGDAVSIQKKIEEWNEEIEAIGQMETIPISASYGCAYGKGAELEAVVQQADAMMYENKRRFHAENRF